MPGLSLSMGMMQEQRLEMSQKLEQTITLSMAMVVQQHAVMNLPGVADPERVRIFKLPGRGRHAMTVVAKLLSGDSERPYAEAAALEAFKERGFATPELIGVCSFGEQHLMLTRLERGVVNCATLMTKPTEVLPKYLRQQKVLLTEELFDSVLARYVQADRLAVANLLLKDLQAGRIVRHKKLGPAIAALHTPAGIAEIRELLVSQAKIPLVAFSTQCLTQHLVPVLANRVACALGAEVAQQQVKGVAKRDIVPRNVLVRFDTRGQVDLIHTGFQHTVFHGAYLPYRMCRELNDEVESQFLGIDREFTENCRAAFIEGYIGARHDESRAKHILAHSPQATLMTLAQDNQGLNEQPQQSTGARASEHTVSVKDQMERVVLELADSELRVSEVCERWYTLVRDALSLEGVAWEDRRGYKALTKLYQLMLDNIDQSVESLKSCDDDEIRMNASSVSKCTMPVRAKFGIPAPREARALLGRMLVLRFWLKAPLASHQELLKAILDQVPEVARAGELNARRTLSKHISVLQDEGRVAKLESQDAQRVADCMDRALSSGDILDLEECAFELALQPADIEPLWEALKRERMRVAIESEFSNGVEPNATVLALQFDSEVKEVELTLESVRSSLDIVQPKAPQAESVEELELPIVPSGEARSSQVVVSSDTEALNCERQKRYPSEATSLILARLDADPACDDRAIASEIGPDWDAQRVRRCITHLIRERGLVERVEEVRSLVVNHPHIQDQGIRERTGLSDLDIHLILHDELVSGRMRL